MHIKIRLFWGSSFFGFKTKMIEGEFESRKLCQVDLKEGVRTLWLGQSAVYSDSVSFGTYETLQTRLSQEIVKDKVKRINRLLVLAIEQNPDIKFEIENIDLTEM